MNKNVNLILVFVIIFVVGGIAVATVYFQDIFSAITGKYSSTTDQLINTQDELTKYKSLYEDTLIKLNQTQSITEAEKSDLRQVYIVKKDLAEQLNGTLVSTQTQLSNTQQILFDTSNQLTEKTNLYNNALNDITSLRADLTSRDLTISNLRTSVTSLRSQLTSCQDQLSGGG